MHIIENVNIDDRTLAWLESAAKLRGWTVEEEASFTLERMYDEQIEPEEITRRFRELRRISP